MLTRLSNYYKGLKLYKLIDDIPNTYNENYPSAFKKIKGLLESGTNPNILIRSPAVLPSLIVDVISYSSPLIKAVGAKNKELVELLLSHDADPNLKGAKNFSPSAVYKAIGVGNLDILQLLLARGANPNSVDSIGTGKPHFETPLTLCVKCHSFAAAELLVMLNANPNIKPSPKSKSPIQLAKKHGMNDFIELFQQKRLKGECMKKLQSKPIIDEQEIQTDIDLS